MTKTMCGGKKVEVKKTEWSATIYDGYSHIERRVYEDKLGFRYVVINGLLWDINSLFYEVSLYC